MRKITVFDIYDRRKGTMKTQKHHMEGLIALLLFGVFAVCLMAVLLTGASAYRNLTDRDRTAYDRRVCTQYLAARVRQGDRQDGVRIEPFGDGDALLLIDDIGGFDYATYVYVSEGYLMELFCAVDSGLAPDAGSRIMPANGLDLNLEGNRLDLVLTPPDADASPVALTLSLRSGEEAAA